MSVLRLATRKSALALAQARQFARALEARHPGLAVEEVHVVTEGDRRTTGLLSKAGGKGLFVAEVEAAIADGRADFAVHSMKDVPATLAEGMVFACVPLREDPRDVLVTKDGTELDGLTAGSRVGTSSLRRACQLRSHRNDLAYAILRGNVDTRLRKLDEGQYDAIVLAHAGLLRLGLADRPLWPIPADVSLPAVGQGALAVECRADDAPTLALLRVMEDAPTRIAVEAERACAAALDGGCATPLAAHARIEGSRLHLDGLVGSLDGERIVRAGTERPLAARDHASRIIEAVAVGEEIASMLLSQGAAGLLAEARAIAERGEAPFSN
jgi:hydroxymethylbilane synthase